MSDRIDPIYSKADGFAYCAKMLRTQSEGLTLIALIKEVGLDNRVLDDPAAEAARKSALDHIADVRDLDLQIKMMKATAEALTALAGDERLIAARAAMQGDKVL